MSNLQYSINANATKGPFSSSLLSGSITAVMNSAGFLAQTLNLGTTTTSVTTASASALGFAFLRNISTSTAATATVSFGRLVGTTLHEVVRLRPSEVAFLRLAPGDYAARAATSNLPMTLQILED